MRPGARHASAYKAIILGEEDGNTCVYLADCQGDEHREVFYMKGGGGVVEGRWLKERGRWIRSRSPSVDSARSALARLRDGGVPSTTSTWTYQHNQPRPAILKLYMY